MNGPPAIIEDLEHRFAGAVAGVQPTQDGIPTVWISPDRVHAALRYLQSEVDRPYRMLYDLTAIDERLRRHAQPPARDFTVLYHLFSFDRNDADRGTFRNAPTKYGQYRCSSKPTQCRHCSRIRLKIEGSGNI